MKHIVSHKNPDTDTIVAAITYAKLLNKQGIEAKPVRIGVLNKETEFLLKELNIEAPQLVQTLPEGTEIVLVDHNEKTQSIDNIDELNLTGIIDHHKFDLKTSGPLNIRAEIIGSTASIIAKLYNEANIEIPKIDAKLLISAILSDTLYYRSPTTTQQDRKIVQDLNKIAQYEDLEQHSLDLFAAKSNLGDIEVEKMIKLDYKQFNFGGKDYAIGVMETTNAQYGLDRKEEIIEKLAQIKTNDKLAGVFYSIVDILNEENTMFTSGAKELELLKEIFGAEIKNNEAHLGNILSRKKQIVPKFEAHFNK
jgi:manganese-dependent inorganic pyrophosphatase